MYIAVYYNSMEDSYAIQDFLQQINCNYILEDDMGKPAKIKFSVTADNFYGFKDTMVNFIAYMNILAEVKVEI